VNLKKWLKDRWFYTSLELQRELELLKYQWPLLIPLMFVQYIHSVFHNLVYYIYNKWGVENYPVLQDAGYKLFGLLGNEYRWISEAITYFIIGFIVVFGISHMFVDRKRSVYMVDIINRYLLVISIAFIARIGAFTLTILPSPDAQCRGSSPSYSPPSSAMNIIFSVDASYGCADLIFSAHTGYTTVGALTYNKYGSILALKIVLFLCVFIVGCLLVALQRHYSVDVWLAWYIVPMTWYLVEAYYQDPRPESLKALEKKHEKMLDEYFGRAEQPAVVDLENAKSREQSSSESVVDIPNDRAELLDDLAA